MHRTFQLSLLALLLLSCSRPILAEDSPDLVFGTAVLHMDLADDQAVDIEFFRQPENSNNRTSLCKLHLRPEEWKRFVAMTEGAVTTDAPYRGSSTQDMVGTVQGISIWRLTETDYGSCALLTMGRKTLAQIDREHLRFFTRRARWISERLNNK